MNDAGARILYSEMFFFWLLPNYEALVKLSLPLSKCISRMEQIETIQLKELNVQEV